jgi:antitoxin component YwqK of YwqJK toxin-antitoxin module
MGQVNEEGQYKNDKRVGEWNTSHINGTKRRKIVYKNDKLVSDKKWDDTEHLVYELNYRNGKLDKKSTYWYKNGKPKLDLVYNSGKLDGSYTEYHHSGKQFSHGIMKNDKMQGKWTFWYHNGQKECEVICKNGNLIDGKVWDDDGNEKEGLRFNLTWEGSNETTTQTVPSIRLPFLQITSHSF